MRYPKELKEEVKTKLKTTSVSKLSLEYGISVTTLYKWKKEIVIDEDKSINLENDSNEKESEKITNITKLQSEIKKLSENGKFYEALKLADSIPGPNKQIDIQKASVLYKMGTLKSLIEAKNIYEKYLDNSFILSLYNKVLNAIKIRKKNKRLNFYSKKDAPKNEILIEETEKLILKNLLTKLYCGTITLDEINESNIDLYKKTLLTIAYYEKYNKKMGIRYIKELKDLFSEDKSKLKIINFFTERLKINKKTIFDISLYSKYIGCHVDSNDVIEVLEKSKQEMVKPNSIIETKPVTKIENKDSSQKKEKKQPIIIERQGVKVNSRYKNTRNDTKVNTTIDKKPLIKEVFSDEILEIGKYLYIKMRNIETREAAIIAWDNLEVLINKPITDKYALEKISYIIKKIEELSLLDIKYNENNIKKHLNKSK